MRILTSNHNWKHPKKLPFDEISNTKEIQIGRNCWLGTRVTILPGVKIEDGAIIAAGSVVTKSVPKLAIVGGNPAKIISYRDETEYNELDENKQWLSISDAQDVFNKIDKFNDFLN